MNLSGNTVLITGGTAGIGKAFAEAFYKEGCKVLICGRRKERLKEMAAQFPGMQTLVCDVAKASDREELHEWATKKFPELNVFINNAGVQLATDFHKRVNLEKVHSEVETNFVAPMHLASLFVQHLAKQKDAALINISSGLAFAPLAFMPVYCATKAALHSFTLSLRHQLRDTSIKVFEIAPTSTDTELGHERREDKSQTHGGMPVEEFITAAMEGIRKDELETVVGSAANMRANPQQMFDAMNKR